MLQVARVLVSIYLRINEFSKAEAILYTFKFPKGELVLLQAGCKFAQGNIKDANDMLEMHSDERAASKKAKQEAEEKAREEEREAAKRAEEERLQKEEEERLQEKKKKGWRRSGRRHLRQVIRKKWRTKAIAYWNSVAKAMMRTKKMTIARLQIGQKRK